jgi:hypothetical protein
MGDWCVGCVVMCLYNPPLNRPFVGAQIALGNTANTANTANLADSLSAIQTEETAEFARFRLGPIPYPQFSPQHRRTTR